MKTIFLQAAPNSPEELMFVLLLVVCLVLIILGFFYIQTLASAMQMVSEENRKIAPASMWLLLIPFFNFVYHFIAVNRLGESIGLELRKRGVYHSENKPGYGIGIAAGVLNIASILPDTIGILSTIASLVCWIIYWVKIANCKNLLVQNPQIAR